jgi:hypothetical protein
MYERIMFISTKEYVDSGPLSRDKYTERVSYRNVAMLHENIPEGVYYGTVFEFKYHAKVTTFASNFWKLFPAPLILPKSGPPKTLPETENSPFPGFWFSYSRWLPAERAEVLM